MAVAANMPDYVFEVSWEVCNKVGGIHTVLESLAPTLEKTYRDNLVFVGPDLNTNEFVEDPSLKKDWQKALASAGMRARIGRWKINANPMAILVNINQCRDRKNEIYGEMWNDFGVDSLHGYGDYDDSSLWAYASGKIIELIKRQCLESNAKIILQAHEWQSAMALLAVKKGSKQTGIATVFTTHATTVGRSICDNNKCLYKYFAGYEGDMMSRELHVESKHSSEKAAAVNADCFTTVSEITNKECKQFLGKAVDVILLNGFNISDLPKVTELKLRKKQMRRLIIDIAERLLGKQMSDDTLIISTSGRCDYRPKGYDLYLESVRRLSQEALNNDIIAIMEVPLWSSGPRKDLSERMNSGDAVYDTALPEPYITHDLHNFDTDRIIATVKGLGLNVSTLKTKVHTLIFPVYLNGADGILNCDYYELLSASDLTIYPSYYEPWGYTPLESAAYRVPTVTTNLSGFGLWVNSLLGRRSSLLSDGVEVIDRDDDNYLEAAEHLKNIIMQFSKSTKKTREELSRKCYKIASQADWKVFANNYAKAFSFALNK